MSELQQSADVGSSSVRAIYWGPATGLMPDDQSVTDFLVDHARVSEHVTALIVLLVRKGIITGAECASALQEVVAANLLEGETGGTNLLNEP